MTLALIGPSGRVVPSGSTKSWPLSRRTGLTPAMASASPLSVNLLGGAAKTYEQLYRTQPWIWTVVNKLSRACARLPLKTYDLSDGTGERTLNRTSPVAKLLKKPYPNARSFQLTEYIVGMLCIYGNCTMVKFRGGHGTTPVELWPMPWPFVEVILGEDRPIEAYRWLGPDGRRKTFLADDVVHFSWFNPNSREPYGISPLEPLRTTLALEDAGQRYAISSFGNAARPASFVQSSRNLTKEQRAELREELQAAYGGPDNAFKVALLDNGLDWKPIAFSAQQAELIANRKLSREEVCAVYDVPPPMVGILDNATYSNIDQQHWMLYMDTLAPILSLIESTLMAQLVDGEPAWDGSMVEYSMDGVLRGNIDQRSQAYLRFLQSGVYTPNELRDLENKPRIEDPAADAIYVPVNLEGQSAALRKMKEEAATQAFERQQTLASAQGEQQQAAQSTSEERVQKLLLSFLSENQKSREDHKADLDALVEAIKEMPAPVVHSHTNIPENLVSFAEGAIKTDIEVNPTTPNVELHLPAQEDGAKKLVFQRDEDGRTIGAELVKA